MRRTIVGLLLVALVVAPAWANLEDGGFPTSEVLLMLLLAFLPTLADFTGLSKAYILQSNLRIPPYRFQKELLRDQEKIIGRFYGRRPTWKKAIVTLHDGDSIDLYGEEAT